MENKRNHNPLGKTWDEIEKERKSTRELAAEWWNELSQEKQIDLQHIYRSPSRHPLNAIGLTGREIEEIWKKETKDKTIGFVGGESLALSVGFKPNKKQFVEFNPELFKSYIDKFSDEDKVRAMVVLLENQKEEYKFNCFLAALKQMNLDSNTHSNIMTLVALKDI